MHLGKNCTLFLYVQYLELKEKKNRKKKKKKTGLHSILTHNIVTPVKILQRTYILLTVDTVNCQMFKGAYYSM